MRQDQSTLLAQPGRSSKRKVVRLAWWFGSISVVLAMGLIFFPREYEGLGFWESLYYTIRLFVLEHDLPNFPRTAPLVIIHFVAPLIAVSAVWTAVKRLFHLSPGLRTRWLSGHVVVCGVGRAGRIIAAALKRRGVPVVGVDLGAADDFEDWCAENAVPMIYGNFCSRRVLRRAGAPRARAILFTSGDDLANLEGAVGAYDRLRADKGPPRLIWTHVANERLRSTARQAVRVGGSLGMRFFDTYRIAALRMVHKHFNEELRQGVREVTILGFGKFGRDLLEVLLRDLSKSERLSIQVIDKIDRSVAVRDLAAELGVADQVSFRQADILALELEEAEDRAFFLCTDDDLGNLTGAMALAKRAGATHIYVRMSKWPMSAIAEHLGEDSGVTFINIPDLVIRGLRELPGIFGRAKASDLEPLDDSLG